MKSMYKEKSLSYDIIPNELKDHIGMLRKNLQNVSYYLKIDGGSELVNSMRKDLEVKLEQALNGHHNNCICHCNKDNKDGKGDYYKTKTPICVQRQN